MIKKREDDFVPLGLLTLSAILRNKYDLIVYEPKHRLIETEDYFIVAQDILSYKPDLVGFSTWCISYAALLLIAKELKSLKSNIPIVFGGPQASITSRETLKLFPFVDYILKGEADLSFPKLLDEIWNEAPQINLVPNLVYRDNSKKLIENEFELPVQNLNKLPIPAYDLCSIKKTAKLDIGRGCPFKCTYCTTNDFFSKKYRTKSVDRVIQEMLTIREKLHISNIGFAHDMLTMNKKFVLEMCDRLILLKNEKGIKFKWTCSARIDCISAEMLVKMKEAGCESVFFGIESGSPRIQKQIQKNLNVEKSIKLIDTCTKIGINMYASFILGFPDEKKSDLEATLELLIKLSSKGCLVQSSELSLLPGTPIYESHKDKLKYDGNFSNFSNTLCGKEELKLIQEYSDLFSSFYYLPVKTLKRQEMVFLNKLINKMNLFRSTLFMLSEFIQTDIETFDLVQLYKDVYSQLQPEKTQAVPLVMHWVTILSNYINLKSNNLPPYIEDIFKLEATVALLLTINARWRLEHKKTNISVLNGDDQIIPTPIWKIIKTKFILESTVPSINGWIKYKKRLRKGEYNYLIVAVSPIRCKKIRLKKKEIYLLNNLTELFFTDYVKKVKSVASEEEVLLWVKRMKRLGVVEIKPKLNEI